MSCTSGTKVEKTFHHTLFPICVEYAIRYFGKTSVPFVTYQEEEEGSGVVPILELYQCLAAMPVCKTSLVRYSLVA